MTARYLLNAIYMCYIPTFVKRMVGRIFVLAICTQGIFHQTAFAQLGDFVIEKMHRTVNVERDGTFEATTQLTVRLMTEAAIKHMGQVPLPYSESLQDIEIVEAYTQKADGTKVLVQKDAIFTQAAPVAVSAPMFNDLKYKILVFPEPAVGSRVHFTARTKQKIPFFPGQFSLYETVLSQIPNESTEVRISTPEDYPIFVDVRGFESEAPVLQNGRTLRIWRYKNETPRKPEPYELAESDFGPYLAVTSFKDWADLGKAYLARAEAKSTPTSAVAALAMELTKGVKDRREEARRIYEWVARNVRYVGVFLGLGGFVPREAAQVLETKYGDCKDHTALLIALLKARGIDATPVLVMTGAAFQLPKVPLANAFNHAITYVPEWDLYLDVTSEFSEWGSLPAAVLGKQVLLTGPGKLEFIPKGLTESQSIRNVVKLKMSREGSFSGKTTVTAKGLHNLVLRNFLASIPTGQEERASVAWIRGAGTQAKASFRNSNPRDIATPLLFEVAFDVKEAIPLESPGAFGVPKGLIQSPIAPASNAAQVGERKTPFQCMTESRVEEFEIALPDGIEVAALPKGVLFSGKTTSFQSAYRQEGNTLFVTRTLLRNRAMQWCPPEAWPEAEQLDAAIARDARGQFLLR